MRKFLSGLPVTAVTGIITVAVTLSAFAVVQWQASTDRAAQYYGELRWTTAWPLLQQKMGR